MGHQKSGTYIRRSSSFLIQAWSKALDASTKTVYSRSSTRTRLLPSIQNVILKATTGDGTP